MSKKTKPAVPPKPGHADTVFMVQEIFRKKNARGAQQAIHGMVQILYNRF